MSDPLILFGAMAVGVERFTELLMNAFKSVVGDPQDETDTKKRSLKLFFFRLVSIAIGVISGVVIVNVANFDVFRVVLPNANIQNGLFLSGIFIGLGASPAHEIVKYIEEKKNKASAEKVAARKEAGLTT